MAKAKIVHCEICASAFKAIKGKANRFCCSDCFRSWQASGGMKRGSSLLPEPCANCSKPVQRQKSTRRNGEKSGKVFCNRDCYDECRSREIASRRYICKGCGVEVRGKPGKSDTKYCTYSCRKHYARAKPKPCLMCKAEFTAVKFVKSAQRFVGYNSGRLCSQQCLSEWRRFDPVRKEKISKAFSGDKHPNWRGGITQLNNPSSRGPGWGKIRARALKRDGYRCVDCGITEIECLNKYGRRLDVDHIDPYHNFLDSKKANALSNLESRCASCHRKEEANKPEVQMALPFGRHPHKGWRKGEAHYKAKLSEADVRSIRARSEGGECAGEIYRDYSQLISGRGHIRAIIERKIWKSVL